MNTQDELVVEITRQIQNCSAPQQAKILLQNIEFNFVLNFGEVVKALLDQCRNNQQVLDYFFEVTENNNCILKADVNFDNCAFLQNVFIDKWNYDNNTRCRITGKVIFRHSTFSDTVQLFHLEFAANIFFDACNFQSLLLINNCEFQEHVEFDFTVFDFGLKIYKSTLCKDGYFIGCNFQQRLGILESANDLPSVHFDTTDIQGTLQFEDTISNCLIQVGSDNNSENHSYCLGGITLTNSKFHRPVQIYNRIFGGRLSIDRSEFLDVFVLQNCKLQEIDQENADQIHNENWNIKLRNVEFKRLVVEGNQIKDANLENVNVVSFASFARTKFESLSVKNLSLEKGGDFSDMVVTTPLTRQTSRLFKHYALEVHDRITANGFYAQEMVAYETELNENRWRNIGDLIILNASKWSTNFGKSWFLGALFTLGSGILFFAIMLLFLSFLGRIEFSWTRDGVAHVFRWFMEWFTWFPYVQSDGGFPSSLLPEDSSPLHAILLGLNLVGKIFIVYGVYQTIQAFRKLRFQ